jgi:trigger factor
MRFKVRETGPWQQTLDVEVPVEEVERRLEEVARLIQRRASLPGFRAGRVPLEMVRQHFAHSVEQEFIESFVPQVAAEAVDQARLSPVIPPAVRNLRFSPGQPLTFEAVVDVRPEVEAKSYRKLAARRSSSAVAEADVERVIERLREESAVFDDLTRPAQRGDVVLLDSQRVDANGRRLAGTRLKNRRIELGAPDTPPDLENALLAAEAGQERTFDLRYAADYPNQELAGQTVRYVVRIKKIQAKKLRPLDDNLAREVFRLESLEELRSRVRLNLETEERVRSQREVEGAITDELVRRNPFELPDRLVKWTLERVLHEVTGGRDVSDELRTELEKRYRAGVERSLKREVLLASVARLEGLEVGDEEVAAEIDRMSAAEPRQAARIRARYQSADQRRGLRESLLERKALDWLINQADITEDEEKSSPLVVPAAR